MFNSSSDEDNEQNKIYQKRKQRQLPLLKVETFKNVMDAVVEKMSRRERLQLYLFGSSDQKKMV